MDLQKEKENKAMGAGLEQQLSLGRPYWEESRRKNDPIRNNWFATSRGRPPHLNRLGRRAQQHWVNPTAIRKR